LDKTLWDRVRAILEEAVGIEGDELQSFLESRCGDDLELRAAVMSLIHAYREAEQAGSGQGSTRTYPDRGMANEPAGVLARGARVGPYVVHELVGSGAFGDVYLAEQQEPLRRRVALKLIKPGMESRRVLGRFAAERNTLAMMEHPGIAKIFDAGISETGRPYFAMEFVAGLPITQHCDQQRLGVDARLALFKRVCDAVQHAHEKGVIHRDIKPSNVLVYYEDGKATPKVIDFGVAKALHQPLSEGFMLSVRGEIVGTPAYMSPEQADMAVQGIDTRSDIYSLGVLLY